MRIISGQHKGKKLVGPPDAKTTRPIPDRVKTSLFNLLRGHYEGAHVVDLFAGTGAIGLETASRGAARVLMVEKDKKIARVLETNIEHLGGPPACEVLVGDALGPAVLTRCPRPINLLFADPPYPLVRDPSGWRRVRAQFMKLIDEMTYEGFAALRTPWPFLHKADGGKGVDPASAHRPMVIDLDAASEGDLDALEDELAHMTGTAKFEPVDLTLENAEGPETHVYGSTAVHLYMRKKA
ncbi:MAG: RsmD family RNA methyltransferase [Phycisphaeraceae bacterium]|nr:MAG: RsmD family RNA methyltransferase [Phycisphaeraceae bacterium]